MLMKPQSVKGSPFKSAKWDELTQGRSFRDSDAPVLELLCQWYEVADRCMADISCAGEVQVAYTNDMGDIKALPQLATMKQASAEIRALSKQLGIEEGVESEPDGRESVLYEVIRNRQYRAARKQRA